jgi:hypothetical protein
LPKILLAISLVAVAFIAAPVRAQLYDPRYPVCLQVFGELEGERMDCVFTSMAQCAVTASGRPATCLINPYFAHAAAPPVNAARRRAAREAQYPRPHQ